MLSAVLVLSYALSTNAPLYVHEATEPYRDMGARLEIHQTLPSGFFLDLNPYIWRSRDQGTVGSGGLIARLGWENNRFGVALFHQSEHNFDRVSRNSNLEVDMVELKWKLN